jgi:predicted flap endonuclease-1-like 5' DNA nuclease
VPPSPAPEPRAEPPRPARLGDALREIEPRTEARADLAGLGSVRSEALRGPEAASEQRGGAGDDLKRIRGIGVLVEKKLNGLGINRYAQVAGWTAADVERVSRMLDLAGRIERESWIEQARILSAGGHTEFSRLFDRGEGQSSPEA